MADQIVVTGAREHNLKNITVAIPRNRLVVITGLSGSGKSSLAFDTLYAEGQRRYVESLSAYARQFLEQMEKPDVDSIEGLSPAIAIEQKSASRNPRSTVGTVTEIYDYLRLLYARVGKPFCCSCGRPIAPQAVEQIVDQVLALPPGTRLQVLAPIARGRKGEFRKDLEELRRAGFVRARIDGAVRALAEVSALARNQPHAIEVLVDRIVLREGVERRVADSIEVALRYGDDVVKVEELGEGDAVRNEWLYSQKFACVHCGVSYPELTPRLFSFNSPYGACPTCAGLGTQVYFDPERIVPNGDLPLGGGAVVPLERKLLGNIRDRVLEAFARHYGLDLDTPYRQLPPEVQQALLYGTGEQKLAFRFQRSGRRSEYFQPFPGIVPLLERRYRSAESSWMRQELEGLMSARVCGTCNGARLKREALAVRVGGRTIAEVTAMSVRQARKFFSALELSPLDQQIANLVLREISGRLGFLIDVGLDYLTLDRAAATLSGGESQRIRLATQIGSGLSGVLYILDEPSIGLHQRDNERLLATLRRLRDLGNTVIVVEHDRETILAADHVIDMGPGAGVQGGWVVAQGTPGEIQQHPASLTGQYLSGRRAIPVPARRREGSGWKLVLAGVRHNNLRDVTVEIPLGKLTCVTGVSGSGKSSLILDTLYRALAQKLCGAREKPGEYRELKGWQLLDKVVDVDQAPIGRTPRSNPATYTGVFTLIRELFAQLPEARVRGYGPGRFSFNVRGGRCEACAGEGVITIEMHFLPDVYVACDVCRGKRYNRETLEVRYRGKSIADILEMTVAEALQLLGNVPPIRQKLETLRDVGLDYIRLGQPATTLSGGEAQRVKLAKELGRKASGRTLYILDEPTTGLHFADTERLLEVLNRLVDAGNTVVVIEHNLDVIKAADYVIDLGPEGGDRGGQVVAAGTPEDVARVPASHTGRFLAPILLSRAA